MNAAVLEKLLRRTNPTITEERAALAGGRWEAYLRERVPPPSRLDFGKRRAWQAAYERALALGRRTREREVLVVPVWYGPNRADVAEAVWEPAVAVACDEDSRQIYEETRLDGMVVVARIEEDVVGFIMPSHYYGALMKLPYRNAHYVAVESERIEGVKEIVRVVEAPAVGKPARDLPAYSEDVEPAVAVDGLDGALTARVRRLVEGLRVPSPADFWHRTGTTR
jgi:hypothetical protein